MVHDEPRAVALQVGTRHVDAIGIDVDTVVVKKEKSAAGWSKPQQPERDMDVEQLLLVRVVHERMERLQSFARRGRRRGPVQHDLIAIDYLDARLLPGELLTHAGEPIARRLLSNSLALHVAIDPIGRPTDRGDHEDQHHAEHGAHDRQPGLGAFLHASARYFISRRASVANRTSLSASHSVMAARNSAFASFTLPALSASFPSSSRARPLTQLRPFSETAFLRSCSASLARPRADRAAPRL